MIDGRYARISYSMCDGAFALTEPVETVLSANMQIDMSVEDQWAYEWVPEVYYIDTRKEVNV